MPKISSITKTNSAKQVRPASKSSKTRNWNGLVGAVSASCLVLSVIGISAYIYFTNASVSKSYEYKQEQAKVDELNETQKRLVVQQAAMGSIVKVNDVASTAGMVPVTSQEYLSANQLSAR